MKKVLLSIFGYTFSAVIILMVCAVPVFGIYELGKTTWYLTQFEHDTGTVVGCSGKRFKHKSKYAYVVETKKGARITGRWYGSKSHCERQKGKTVAVLINPENKQKGVVNSFMDRWFLPLTLLSLPGLFLYGYLKKRKDKNKSAESVSEIE